jgi:phage tail-like protein
MTYKAPNGFHFSVKIAVDNEITDDSRFQEVGGLSVELGVEELIEGGENRFSHRLPGPAKYGNLVLKRGMLLGSEVIKWVKNAIYNFQFQPKDVQVALLNDNHQHLSTWNFVNAYPVKWVVSDFKAQENSLVIETLELAYNFFNQTDADDAAKVQGN